MTDENVNTTEDENQAAPAPNADGAATEEKKSKQRPMSAEATELALWALSTGATFKLREMPLGALKMLSRALSQSTLVAKELQDQPVNVFLVLLKGAELDVSVTTALTEITIISGKLSLSSHLQNALVLRSGRAKLFRIILSDDTKATLELQRIDWEAPTTIDFTIEDARKLGLTSKHQWQTQPANMLRRRVITRGAREYFGDVVIAYDQEELEIEVGEGTFLSPPPAAWGKAPKAIDSRPVDAEFEQRHQEYDDQEASERENARRETSARAASTAPAAAQEPARTLTPGTLAPSDIADILARFAEKAAKAASGRDLDNAQSLLAKLFAAAEAGNADAILGAREAEQIYNKQVDRLKAAVAASRQRRNG